jgi:predicted nuclease with TOPRIM domain
MREQLQIRLEELKKEFDAGQTRLQELDRRQTALRETLLRISGAVQVLEEMLISSEQAQTPLTQSASSTS